MFTTYTKPFLVLTALFLFSGFTTMAQNSVVQKYETGNVYAGIEVGSKGVKMSTVELDKQAGEDGEFKILKDTSINTDFISFTQPTLAPVKNLSIFSYFDYIGLTTYNTSLFLRGVAFSYFPGPLTADFFFSFLFFNFYISFSFFSFNYFSFFSFNSFFYFSFFSF